MQKYLPFFSLTLILVSFASRAEFIETNQAPDESSLVIYPDGQALVREKRSAQLLQGANKILIRNIPREVEVSSIVFQAFSPKFGVDFVEYSFQSDQITRQSLLEGSIGLNVQLLNPSIHVPPQSVRLLAVDNTDAIVETVDGIQAVDSARIAFHKIPYRLTQHPLMTIKLQSETKTPLNYEVSYIAHGLSWDASYTILVSNNANSIDMNTWIHIHNASGVEFTKAKIRTAESEKEEDSVVYSIERPITLPDLSSKNVEWFTAKDVPTTTSYRIYSQAELQTNEEGVSTKPSAEIWLSVKNHENQGLGQALPAGIIKVFQKTPEDRVQYMGENKTTAIVRGEVFSLRLGKSNDLTAEVRQTDFRRLSNHVVETGYSVILTNHTERSLDVGFIQNFQGEWTVLRETHDHTDFAKDAIEWRLNLRPKETETLRFRTRMKI